MQSSKAIVIDLMRSSFGHDGASASAESSPLLRPAWRNAPSVVAEPAAAIVVEEDDHTPLNATTTTATPTVTTTNATTDDHGADGEPRYTYPVATFVRDLVRTSMSSAEFAALSIRSDGNLLGSGRFSGGTTSSTTTTNNPQTTTTTIDPNSLTVRTLNDLDETMEADFILVDGDLIAVPPQPPNEQEREIYEDNLRAVDEVRASCQPNRLRRGVRKVNRLWKKIRKSAKEHVINSSHLQRQQQQDQGSAIGSNNARRGGADTTGDSSSTLTPIQQASQPQPSLMEEIHHSSSRARLASDTSLASISLSDHHPAPDAASRASSSTDTGTSPSRRHRRRGKADGNTNKRLSWRRGTDDHKHKNDNGRLRPIQDTLVPSNPDTATAGVPYALAATAVAHPPAIAPTPQPFGSGNATAVGNGSRSASFDDGRTHSVTASFVGTADQLLEAGVLPEGIAAEAYVEYEDPTVKKEDDVGGSVIHNIITRDSDLKVDKVDGPDVDTMLRRAAFENSCDLESSDAQFPSKKARVGKNDGPAGSSIPLSLSHARDTNVHNDTLKVVMVGCLLEKTWLARALRQSKRRSRKRKTLGLDVNIWSPTSASVHKTTEESPPTAVKFSVWDTQGATSTISGSPNFGGHPATQSLFFSSQSLYVLVWDLAVNNKNTNLKVKGQTTCYEDDEEDDEDEYECDFSREEANRQADRALQADIQNRVLHWVDRIARSGPKSAILPVAVVPEGMSDAEVKRRCAMMQFMLEQHIRKFAENAMAPKLLSGAENTLCVNLADTSGLAQLQETIIDIATDSSRSVFDHIGTPVPEGVPLVLDKVRKLATAGYKLVLIDHLLIEVAPYLDMAKLVSAVNFLSNVGEVIYYGQTGDEILSQFVIISNKWLVSALSCVLRNDLKNEVDEQRRFMRMQCLYGDEQFPENEIVKVLSGATTSSCPLLSGTDAQMLWQSMSFMREAADCYGDAADDPSTAPSMFFLLERLLVTSGILVPLDISKPSFDSSEVFFVPSLLPQVDPRDIWTYRSSESWMTTLCHTWLFRDGASSDLMEKISVGLIKDLYEFSRAFRGTLEKPAPVRSRTLPVARPSLHDFYEDHNEQAIGRVKIHQLMCWESSILVKIGCVFADRDTDELRESFVEILVTILDNSSSHCVATDTMRMGMHRVIVTGKGQVGHHGRKMWNGGYKVVVDSVRDTMASYSNVVPEVVCPDCLAHTSPNNASTWGWDSVLAAAESGSTVVRCMRLGHKVDSNLVCGKCDDSLKAPPVDSGPATRSTKPVAELLPSVVLVGLWDPKTSKITSVGSGFIVDRKLGLVVTAGHVLFNMEDGRHFGTPYFGLRDARAVIGVIGEDGHTALFRYFAEIVADDIHSVDACVLRIKTRMEKDVDDEGSGCAEQPEKPIDDFTAEQLKPMKLTSRFELEEAVRILGFNQGGEGVYHEGEHIIRTADFASGYICRKFKAVVSDDSSSSDHSSSDASSQHFSFSPREEIVVRCPTISGHSGGPCVNEDGRVVGVLSRADPVDRHRCYLVPATEIKLLVNKAKKKCSSLSL